MEVSGGDGTFSGLGSVVVPYMGIKFFCRFDNIKVNEKQEIIVGEVIVLRDDAETFKKRLIENNEKKKKSNTKGTSFEGVEIKFDGTIDSLYVNEAGEVIAVMASNQNPTTGSTKKEERKIETKKGADNRITDDSGNVYVLGKDGTIEKEGAPLNNDVSAPDKPVSIDASYLDDFEKLVKEVIDTMYATRVIQRDSLQKVKDKELKELNKNVEMMKYINDESTYGDIVFESDVPEIILNLSILDMIVEEKKNKIITLINNLNQLNDFLKKIKSFSAEVKSKEDYYQIATINDKKNRILKYIKSLLKE